MDFKRLEELYEELKNTENPYDLIFDLKENLLSSDEDNVLEIHYKMMYDKALPDEIRQIIKSFFYADVANIRDKVKVSDFLYNKYKNGLEDDNQKANVIQLLGNLRSLYAKDVALENIRVKKGILRYNSIIVLGWVGGKDELEVLTERLLNDPDPQLRGYSATAMRQIWYKHPKTKNDIFHSLKEALVNETEDTALIGIIITTQDLLKKKLGLKESRYGDVSGDVKLAKIKAQKALNS